MMAPSHLVLHIKISFFLCWRVENNYKSKSQHFMHQCIVSNKNFDFRTCGTQKFWQILTYQKIEQNWLVNPAQIFKKKIENFLNFTFFSKFSPKMLHILKVNIILRKCNDEFFFKDLGRCSNFDMKIPIHGCTKTPAEFRNLKNLPFFTEGPTYILRSKW